jgi:hypothetical protein
MGERAPLERWAVVWKSSERDVDIGKESKSAPLKGTRVRHPGPEGLVRDSNVRSRKLAEAWLRLGGRRRRGPRSRIGLG